MEICQYINLEVEYHSPYDSDKNILKLYFYLRIKIENNHIIDYTWGDAESGILFLNLVNDRIRMKTDILQRNNI